MDLQSSDIALGTNDEVGGAGDQGIMFGYACQRNMKDICHWPISIAHHLSACMRLTKNVIAESLNGLDPI